MIVSRLIHGDCIEVMADIPDGSVDAIIADLPYGTTSCHWDTVIPFEPLWTHYKRVIKPNGAIVLFGSEPFSSALRMSNIKNYKYDWIWNKKLAGNGQLAKHQPLKVHELIHVFSGSGRAIYLPQKTKGILRRKMTSGMSMRDNQIATSNSFQEEYTNDDYYPKSILDFSLAGCRKSRLHPTQKPVELLEYLIRTYTNEGETVLDNTAGVMTTAIACLNTNREYICIEKDDKYFALGSQRVEAHIAKMKETAVQLPMISQ